MVTDAELSPKRRDEILDLLNKQRTYVIDEGAVKAWVFALVGDKTPVGCLAFYPPQATALWVRADYQGTVRATEMIERLVSSVKSRFPDVDHVDALVHEEHKSCMDAFLDAGWGMAGTTPSVGGRFLVLRKKIERR